ncbi:hypothetical protein ACTFIU_004045 [Dictyostelium citrinum]
MEKNKDIQFNNDNKSLYSNDIRQNNKSDIFNNNNYLHNNNINNCQNSNSGKFEQRRNNRPTPYDRPNNNVKTSYTQNYNPINNNNNNINNINNKGNTHYKSKFYNQNDIKNENKENNNNNNNSSFNDKKLNFVSLPSVLKNQKETDEEKIKQRQKQIDFGKNTIGYDNYIQKVPKDKRDRSHPRTPDKYQKCSRRSWLGQVKIWRKALHKFDPNKSDNDDSDIDYDNDQDNHNNDNNDENIIRIKKVHDKDYEIDEKLTQSNQEQDKKEREAEVKKEKKKEDKEEEEEEDYEIESLEENQEFLRQLLTK